MILVEQRLPYHVRVPNEHNYNFTSMWWNETIQDFIAFICCDVDFYENIEYVLILIKLL